MKKLFAILAVVGLLTVVGAVPAGADNPEPFEESFSFSDTNPCTGEEIVITINVVVRVHEHRNNFVLNIKRSGMTSDGFVMKGPETQQYNPVSATAGAQFKDFWTNSETGQRFHVRGKQNVVFGDGIDAPPTEVKVDNFSLRCVRD